MEGLNNSITRTKGTFERRCLRCVHWTKEYAYVCYGLCDLSTVFERIHSIEVCDSFVARENLK